VKKNGHSGTDHRHSWESREVLNRHNIVTEGNLRSAFENVGNLHEESVKRVSWAQNGA
jgi:hypothetical protein